MEYQFVGVAEIESRFGGGKVTKKKNRAVRTYLFWILLPLVVGLILGLVLVFVVEWDWVHPFGVALLVTAVVVSLLSLRAKTAWKLLWWAHSIVCFSGAGYFLLQETLRSIGWPTWIGALLGVLGIGLVVASIWALGKERIKKRASAQRPSQGQTEQDISAEDLKAQIAKAAKSGNVSIHETLRAFVDVVNAADGTGVSVEVSELMRQLASIAETRNTEALAKELEATVKLFEHDKAEVITPEERAAILRGLVERLGGTVPVNEPPVVPSPVVQGRKPVHIGYTPGDCTWGSSPRWRKSKRGRK